MNRIFSLIVLLILMAGCSPAVGETDAPTAGDVTAVPVGTDDPYARQRAALVDEIAAMGVQDVDVLQAMAAVPRHEFMIPEYLIDAYDNHAFPIGYGQTISQPYIVAWMTELLALQPGEKVLEIGTGSGYQAAVLAQLGYVEVYSIEIVPELAERAKATLARLSYTAVHSKQGDGYYGWAEYAPFDAIIVTAAPDHLPAPLVAQLSEHGRIVIPIGPPGWAQTLWKFVEVDGELTAYNMGGVGFVPFIGPGVEEHESGGSSNP